MAFTAGPKRITDLAPKYADDGTVVGLTVHWGRDVTDGVTVLRQTGQLGGWTLLTSAQQTQLTALLTKVTPA